MALFASNALRSIEDINRRLDDNNEDLSALEDNARRSIEDLNQRLDDIDEDLNRRLDDNNEDLNQRLDDIDEDLNQRLDDNEDDVSALQARVGNLGNLLRRSILRIPMNITG